MTHTMHGMHVAVLQFPDTRTFDCASAVEVFSLAVQACGKGDVVTVPISDSGDSPVQALHKLESRCDVLVIPGFRHPDAIPVACDDAVARLLEQMRRAGSSIVGLCTGAFWIAATGLIDGRLATTHWRYCRELAQRRPAANVRENVLYVEQDGVWTSAGMSAGIDTCLAVIRARCGAAIAATVADTMTVSEHRSGTWPQRNETRTGAAAGGMLPMLRRRVRHNPAASWTCTSMARAAGVSARTLERQFQLECGITPSQWLMGQRVDLARELLERTDWGMDAVAHTAGWSDADALRRGFARVLGMTPQQYRARHHRSA